jgi:hypothetical protein
VAEKTHLQSPLVHDLEENLSITAEGALCSLAVDLSPQTLVVLGTQMASPPGQP